MGNEDERQRTRLSIPCIALQWPSPFRAALGRHDRESPCNREREGNAYTRTCAHTPSPGSSFLLPSCPTASPPWAPTCAAKSPSRWWAPNSAPRSPTGAARCSSPLAPCSPSWRARATEKSEAAPPQWRAPSTAGDPGESPSCGRSAAPSTRIPQRSSSSSSCKAGTRQSSSPPLQVRPKRPIPGRPPHLARVQR